MHFVFSSMLALVAFVAAQTTDPSISTPASLVQCQPAQITWTATHSPVFLSVIPGGQVGATPLQDFGQQTGNTYTWNVNIPAGTQVTMQIRDSQGVTAFSAPVTIQSSSDSSCLGQSGSATPSGASSTAAGPSTTQAVPSSVSASVSSAASSAASSASSSLEASTSSAVVSLSSVVSTATHPSSASSTRSATATSASASASASPNAARSNAQVGFAGLLGLVAAAIMA